jgi:hypothetical protein
MLGIRYAVIAAYKRITKSGHAFIGALYDFTDITTNEHLMQYNT